MKSENWLSEIILLSFFPRMKFEKLVYSLIVGEINLGQDLHLSALITQQHSGSTGSPCHICLLCLLFLVFFFQQWWSLSLANPVGLTYGGKGEKQNLVRVPGRWWKSNSTRKMCHSFGCSQQVWTFNCWLEDFHR